MGWNRFLITHKEYTEAVLPSLQGRPVLSMERRASPLSDPSELDNAYGEEKRMEIDARYPIGTFTKPGSVSPEELKDAIMAIAGLPGQLRNAVEGLDPDRLMTPYRKDGWTVQQLVHHIADSHMNAFVRTRLALTEEWPVITPYDEKAWANLHDSLAPVQWSLELIEALHARWVMLLFSLKDEQWKRGYTHPVNGRTSIETATMLYAWHSRHHLAHITQLRLAEGW